MVPLPYPRLLGGVSLIYAKGPFWERPVYTLFALYGGGGWQYGLGLDQGLLWPRAALNICRVSVYYTCILYM